MGQNNQWLKPVLAQGVAMLLLLRLKNSPTEDVIQPTMAQEKAQVESNLQRLKAILRGKR